MTDVDTEAEPVPHEARRRRAERNRRRHEIIRAGLVAGPWLWFLLRNVPVSDYLAMVLPLVVGAGLWVCFVFGASALSQRRYVRWALAGLVSWFVFGGVALFGPRYPQATAAPLNPIRMLAANAALNDESVAAALDADPSVELLVVAEPSERTAALLQDRFPYVTGILNVVVASDFPLTPVHDDADELFRRARALRLQVGRPSDPFILYATHLPKAGADLAPWTRVVDGAHVEFATAGTLTAKAHRQLAADLAARAKQEPLPTVLAGDFNSPDRAGDYRALAKGRVDALRSGWAGGTSTRTVLIRTLSLRIDHILLPPGWCAVDGHRVALPGSDHWGVTSTVGVCPAKARR